MTLGHTLSADDTADEYIRKEDIEFKLNTNNDSATDVDFLIRWGKVSILTNKDINETKEIIKN